MYITDQTEARITALESRVLALEKKGSPPKPKSAEEWLDSRNAWVKTDPCKDETWAFYTSEFPDKIVESLGIRRSMTALRVPRKMFLIALDKVLRDHGEIE